MGKNIIKQLLFENNKIGERKILGTFQKWKKEIIDGFSSINLYTITSQSSYLFPYGSQKQLGKGIKHSHQQKHKMLGNIFIKTCLASILNVIKHCI